MYVRLTLIVLSCLLIAAPVRADNNANDLKKLRGTWKVVAVEAGGEKVPADKFGEMSFDFTSDSKLIVSTEGDEKELSYTIDAAKKPKTIDIVETVLDYDDVPRVAPRADRKMPVEKKKTQDVPKDDAPVGQKKPIKKGDVVPRADGPTVQKKPSEKKEPRFLIYAFDGDNLQICGSSDGKTRPQELSSKGEKQLLTLKREDPKMLQDRKESAKRELDKLQGDWSVTSYEELNLIVIGGGKDEKKEEKASPAVIKGNKLTIKFPAQEVTYELLAIDPAKNPKQISLKERNWPVKSIYELSGDTLKLCLAPKFPPRADRPTEFDAKSKSQLTLIVMKREKK